MDENKKIATRQSYGEELAKIGELNSKIVVLDADLSTATKTNIFASKFPNRFFDVGIAEQDLMGTAAGFATCGKIPYVSTFAVFAAGRAYDQVRNSICYPNLNVKICATHAGVTVGEDGASHQMLEDLGMMRALPNMKVFSPSDDAQTRWIINEISNMEGPAYVRLCRLKSSAIYDENQKFEIGKSIVHGTGTDATIFATGITVSEALKAKEILEKEGINVSVVDMCSIKPIDKETIIKCAEETNKLISVEDHSIACGLGSAISEVLTDNYPKKLTRLGLNDSFGKSGKAEELLKYFKIDAEAIIDAVRN